jgi:two-component sensor histidine kinase
MNARVKNNLSVMLDLVKLQAEYPPVSAAAALARVAGQIVTLAAIYDESTEAQDDDLVDLKDWCEKFIASISKGLAKGGYVAFECEDEAIEIPLEAAQGIGLTLGELVSDASERSRATGVTAKILVELERETPTRFALRVKDGAPSESLPAVARLLAREFGGELLDLGAAHSCERELLFQAAVP